MHKTSLTTVSLVLFLTAAAYAVDQTPPTYDMKGQSLFDLQAV